MIQNHFAKLAEYWKPVKRYVTPLLGVWGIVAYIHGVQSLFLLEVLPSELLFLPFIPILLFEFWRSPGHAQAIQTLAIQPDARTRAGGRKKSRSPQKSRDHQRVKIDGKWLALWGSRVLFWFGFYAMWVAYVYRQTQSAQWLKWFAPQFYLQFYLVFRAEQWLTLVAFVLWLCAYVVLTVRWGKLHLFTALILPMILAVALFVHLYNFGGVGNTPARARRAAGRGRTVA